MDKLTREAHEHGKILESMVFFEKFLKTITSEDAENYTVHLHQFSDEYIVQHFKFEEQEIFPFIFQKGSSEERKFIEELLEDHEQILVSLENFKEIISLYDSQPPTKEQVKKIIKLARRLSARFLFMREKRIKGFFLC